MNINPHIGSSLDSFLEEEGIAADTDAIALQRVLAWQITQVMSERATITILNRPHNLDDRFKTQ
ncbi:MAG: hypothetical protein F6J92_14840 [Symploca sp. SIO1A3]|nr:hypothetical protein [Symploca sp. SIO1A3]